MEKAQGDTPEVRHSCVVCGRPVRNADEPCEQCRESSVEDVSCDKFGLVGAALLNCVIVIAAGLVIGFFTLFHRDTLLWYYSTWKLSVFFTGLCLVGAVIAVKPKRIISYDTGFVLVFLVSLMAELSFLFLVVPASQQQISQAVDAAALESTTRQLRKNQNEEITGPIYMINSSSRARLRHVYQHPKFTYRSNFRGTWNLANSVSDADHAMIVTHHATFVGMRRLVQMSNGSGRGSSEYKAFNVTLDVCIYPVVDGVIQTQDPTCLHHKFTDYQPSGYSLISDAMEELAFALHERKLIKLEWIRRK